MLTIGIPRALHYYKYYPMWRAFFEGLGFNTVISPATNRDCVEPGTKRLVSDTCIPVKAYIGHALALKDKCDLVFVPVLRSLEKHVYNCSRFLGLPDLVRVAVPEIKQVIDIDIDISRGDKDLKKRLAQFGRVLNTDLDRVREALNKARAEHSRFVETLQKYQLTYQEGIDFLYNDKKPPAGPATTNQITIGVLGHPYVVNDAYLNHNLIERLRKEGVRVVTPEMLTEEELQQGIKDIGEQSYWTSESDVIGATGAYHKAGYNGIIGVTAFSCGPDSLMMSLVQHYCNITAKIPFLLLTIDEHSSETGLLTRLEAFLEMINRQKRMANQCA